MEKFARNLFAAPVVLILALANPKAAVCDERFDCNELLLSGVMPREMQSKLASLVREQVLSANARLANGVNAENIAGAWLRGTEYLLLSDNQAAGQSVLSLGSGPDVFRPVFSFPLASDYHLIDKVPDTPRS